VPKHTVWGLVAGVWDNFGVLLRRSMTILLAWGDAECHFGGFVTGGLGFVLVGRCWGYCGDALYGDALYR
jgi:hypothetical protein